MIKLVNHPPIIIDTQLINVAIQLINAMHKRAWISFDTVKRLRALVTKDIRRSIKEISCILVDLTKDVKVSNSNKEENKNGL